MVRVVVEEGRGPDQHLDGAPECGEGVMSMGATITNKPDIDALSRAMSIVADIA